MGVWIEIFNLPILKGEIDVTPFVGVWIEIMYDTLLPYGKPSLPSWECGLKCSMAGTLPFYASVTPFVGVWIEILTDTLCLTKQQASLPSWECGLKSTRFHSGTI